MEFIFAFLILLFAAGGLAIGLVLTGKPPQSSCGGLSCNPKTLCDGCPNRARKTAEVKDG